MADNKTDLKTVVMSFAVTEDLARQIRSIPSHTVWIRDLVEKNLGVCPCCSQSLKTAHPHIKPVKNGHD